MLRKWETSLRFAALHSGQTLGIRVRSCLAFGLDGALLSRNLVVPVFCRLNLFRSFDWPRLKGGCWPVR